MFHTAESLQGHGDSPALIAGATVMSYAGLAEAAERFAARLPQARGLIAIEMTPAPATIAAYLGALQAGHAVLPLPAGEPELARGLEARFRPAASWRTTGGRVRLLHYPRPAALHPDLFLLLTTSGSTGQGRGVRLSRAAVAANAAAIVDYLEIGPQDRAALVLPLHYSYGLSVLHSHLARGASLWLGKGSVLDPGFLPALAASGATSFAGVPHHFRMLRSIGADARLPPALTCMTVAGGAMPAAEVRHWAGVMAARHGRFVPMYGQTEATARIAYMPAECATTAPDAIGDAIPGGSLMLRDEAGRPITTPETEGELIYRGPNVMMGYADSAADLARGSELGELATGDLARRGADGFYRITGRRSRMSKIAGLRIGHDALERALGEAGHEVAVWGDDETIWVAARAPAATLQADAARLAGIRAQHVTLVPCAVFPRRANGKIDYPALKERAGPPAADPGLEAIFARTFAPRPVHPTDSFESLGGDSLQHVALSLLLDRRLGGLPPGWEQRPIAELERPAPARAARVAMPMLARALAILAVVVAHQTHWPVYGGAAAMVILLGMSVARHRRGPLIRGDALGFLAPVQRVLLPYALVLAGFAIAWHQVPWASVFLVGNLALTSPETHLMLPYLYWFVEAYVQICLMLVLLFRPPPMRAWLAASPFAVGLALLALGVALRVTLPEVWPLPDGRSQFSVPWVFYLFALGWCTALAQGAAQRGTVLAAAALIMPLVAWLGGNWYGSWEKYMSLLVLVALLLHVETVRLPRPAVRGVMHLANAAFPIYLLHRLVPEHLMPGLGLNLTPVAENTIAILGGLALGLLAARGLDWLTHLRWAPGLGSQEEPGFRLGQDPGPVSKAT